MHIRAWQLIENRMPCRALPDSVAVDDKGGVALTLSLTWMFLDKQHVGLVFDAASWRVFEEEASAPGA